MTHILSIIIGYLLGSIPTAYLLMRKFNGINITTEGSKNVGALNSYELSRSKLLGLSIFVIDFLKGFAAVFIVQQFLGNDFLYSVLALGAAILSHCYNPWIKFKGGRGLATALGGTILFAYSVPVIWIVFWLVAFLFRRHIHFSNIAATILTGAIAISNSDILNKYTKERADENWIFGVSVALIMAIIMSRHSEPFKEWFFHQKRKSSKDFYETD